MCKGIVRADAEAIFVAKISSSILVRVRKVEDGLEIGGISKLN